MGTVISVTLLLVVWGVRVCLPRIVRWRRGLPVAWAASIALLWRLLEVWLLPEVCWLLLLLLSLLLF